MLAGRDFIEKVKGVEVGDFWKNTNVEEPVIEKSLWTRFEASSDRRFISDKDSRAGRRESFIFDFYGGRKATLSVGQESLYCEKSIKIISAIANRDRNERGLSPFLESVSDDGG